MFSFHKPRVYRSAEGCCICRAKSSSSRFTDSKKYEADSVKCFNLKIPRHGEICNACVLLVKRYKRLPTGSNRHWGHVVDARAGPGMKSMTKFKKMKEEATPNQDRGYNQKSLIPEKFSKIFKKNKKKVAKDKNKSQQWESQPLPPTPESLDSDCEDIGQYTQTAVNAIGAKTMQPMNLTGSSRRKCLPPKRFRNRDLDKFKFYDENLWIKRKSCCGTVLEHKQLGAIIIDTENYVPCVEHRRKSTKDRTTTTGSTQHLNVTQQCTVKSGMYQLKPNPPPEVRSTNPTPVLKKHHLFFKRQSESFPLGDMKQSTINAHEYPPKTDVLLEVKVLSTSFPTSSTVKVAKLDPVMHTINHLPSTSNKVPSLSSLTVAAYGPQQQQHQVVHKPSSSKSNSFLHKMKSDTGKIVKHSLEKINTLRLKPSELTEVKNIAKTVDKTFLVRPIASASLTITQERPKKTVVVDNGITSAIQSVATKFNDNSSDSGFDENMQERKSVSPLNTANIKISQLIENKGAGGLVRHQPGSATIIASASSPANITNITLPSTTSANAAINHTNKTLTNIILNNSNAISTSSGQNVVIVKTKYNGTSNLNPNSRKN